MWEKQKKGAADNYFGQNMYNVYTTKLEKLEGCVLKARGSLLISFKAIWFNVNMDSILSTLK